MARATWSTVESGATARPRAITRVRIARVLGVTPSTIWRNRPRPLHLQDVDDPRWRAAVLGLARRVEREGSDCERRRLGERLIAVLDQADRGFRDADPYDGRFDELWQLGASLTLDPETPSSPLLDDRVLQRELRGLERDAPTEAIAARRAGEEFRAARGHDPLAARKLR